MERRNIKRTVVEPVPLSYFHPGEPVTFDLYTKEGNGYTHFLRPGEALEAHHLHTLQTAHLYLNIRHREALDHYLSRCARQVVTTSRPLPEKCAYLYDSATKILKNYFENPEKIERIGMAVEVAEATLEVILAEPKAFHSLLQVSSHDYNTFSHSVDVLLYALGLGSKLELPTKRLYKLAAGAILHDIGKTKIPLEIVNKQGALSPDEYRLMREHPVHGGELLMELGEEDGDILAAVIYHHEKYNGKGYPSSLEGSEIPLLAQIIAIADVFAALSTKRSYKDAMDSFSALKIMKEDMEGHFEPKLLTTFIHLMGENS